MKKSTLKTSASLVISAAVLSMIASACAEMPVREEADVDRVPSDITPAKAEQPKASLEIMRSEAQQTEASKDPKVARQNMEASAEYHFSLAQAYVAEGNPDRAIEEYRLTLMFDPNSPLVYARLATEYVKKGMLSAAMDTCKEALQRDPAFVDARLMLAGLYSTAHQSDQALNEYDRVLKSDPKHEEAAVYKAQTLSEMGRSTEALAELRKFSKKAPDSVLVHYYLGRAEQREGFFKEAVKAYKKSIELRPSFTQASLALGYLYEEKRMNTEAVSVYKELYDAAQDMAAASRLATIYLKEEKYEQALPYLEAVQAADLEDMGVRVKLGLVQMELKRFTQAIATFKEILVKNPDSDRIHYYLGSLYEEIKQLDEAVVQLKAVLPTSKLFADAALHVAYLLKLQGKAAEAKTYIRESITRSPGASGFYVFEASLEEDAKNIDGAIGVLETAVDKFPEDEKIRYYLGSLYDKQGSVDKGIAQMEAILKTNPDNVDALNYIGYAWTSKGIRLNDAEKLLRRALALRPDNGYIQDSWGWYLYTRGRVSEAIVQLEKAARMKPNEATILEHLGDAYLRSNLREKAMLQYSDAAKYADNSASKLKLEAKIQSLNDGTPGSSNVRMPAGKASPEPVSVSTQPHAP